MLLLKEVCLIFKKSPLKNASEKVLHNKISDSNFGGDNQTTVKLTLKLEVLFFIFIKFCQKILHDRKYSHKLT